MTMIYGFLVAGAAVMAYKSRSELLQKAMAILLVGWLVYANAQSYASFADRVNFNMCLDATLFIFTLLLYLAWRELSAAKACLWIIGLLATMASLHIAQLSLGFSLFAYYLAYNGLFILQLAVISVFSYFEMSKIKSRDNKGGTQWTTGRASASHDLKVVSIRTKSA